MKAFRKLTVLVLALALIATVGISASAANYSISQDYSDGSIAMANAELKTHEAFGEIILGTSDAVGNVFNIDLSYSYIPSIGPSAGIEVGPYNESNSATNDWYCSAKKTVDATKIAKLTSVTFSFDATFGLYYPGYGPYSFDPDPVTLTNP